MKSRMRIGALVTAVLAMFVTAAADVPTNMNVQGRLTDGAGDPVAVGLKLFTFKIFDAEAGGNEVWPAGPGEQQTLLTDDNGLWTAQVGAVIALTEAVFQDTSRWLEVTVTDGVAPPETLSRIKLNTNPFTYRSASSQTADAATYANTAGTSTTAANANNLGGQPPSAYASSSHNHTGTYVRITGDDMTGTLRAPILETGNTSLNGSLRLYQAGAGGFALTADIYSSFGSAIHMYEEEGQNTFSLEPDVTGRGGYFLVYGGKSSYYFRAEGMPGPSDSGVTITMKGPSSTTTINTNNSGDGSVSLPTNAIAAPEILDEPGIASDAVNGSVNISQLTTMQSLASVTITIPSSGYIVVEGECYAILSGTTSDNRVIADIGEGTGGTGSSPWFTNDGLKDYASLSGGVFTITPRRWYAKSAGTYTFNFRARHIGYAPASAVLWYPKIVAMYFPTSYGAVAAMVSSDEAAGFERVEPVATVTGDDGSGVVRTEPVYRVDMRELEIRALKARAEAERLERELSEARAADQSRIGEEAQAGSR